MRPPPRSVGVAEVWEEAGSPAPFGQPARSPGTRESPWPPGPLTHPILRGRCRSPGPTAPKSTIQLEIEVPPERLDKALDQAVRALARRTRVPGFRPGKAPRPVLERHLGPGVVLDEAVDHLMQDAYREALAPGGHPAADQRRRGGRPGRGGQAAHLQGDRPGPSRGHPRRLRALPVRPGARDHRRRPGRHGRRGAARPERDPRRGRGPRREGRRLRGHLVRRDTRRRAVRGRHVRPDAAHPRPGAPHPRLRDEPRRPRGRAARPSSTSPSPRTTASRAWPARPPTSRSRVKELREKIAARTSTTTSSPASATSRRSTRCARTSACGSRATRSTAPVTASPTGSSSTPSPTRRSTCPTCSSTRRSR